MGILAYELTIGFTPFTAQTTPALYAKITNHEKHLKFPPDLVLSQAYVSLIKHLITDQKQRYGYEKIVQHSLFKNLDLNTLRDQVPPYIPKITTEDDTSNFSDIRPKKTEANIENFKRKTQFSGRNLPFIGFTYTRDNTEDYSSSYTRNIKIKDETLQDLKNQIQNLRKQLVKHDTIIAEKNELEKRLEEKIIKLESVEHLRDKLEKDLSKTLSECVALKRTLDLERRDRIEIENKALDLMKSAKQKWEINEKTRIDTLLAELQEEKEKNAQLTFINEQFKNTVHLDKIGKLNRKSVIGLESRLEKVTSETQNQLCELQTCLTRERNEKQVFIEELSVCKEKLAEKETVCNEIREELKNTQNELVVLKRKQQEDNFTILTYKEEINKLMNSSKEKINDLEKQLEIKQEEFVKNQQEKQVCIFITNFRCCCFFF